MVLFDDTDIEPPVFVAHEFAMTEFGVKPPTLMLGTMKVGDRVKVSFDLYVKDERRAATLGWPGSDAPIGGHARTWREPPAASPGGPACRRVRDWPRDSRRGATHPNRGRHG